MARLNLSPLPSPRSNEAAVGEWAGGEDFVDEAAVRALVTGAAVSRTTPEPADLVLAADEMDFAGWSLPPVQRPAPVGFCATPRVAAAVRRPAPPTTAEAGLGEPHRGRHRWWLAGLAGALSSMLFFVLLLSLSARLPSFSSGRFIVEIPAKPTVVKPQVTPPENKPAPQLTELYP